VTCADRLLADDRVQEARLADAVASEHAGDFARLGCQRDAAQGLRRAVMEIDFIDFEHKSYLPSQINLDDALID
jgi:hypothetical protein